jgi:hypothetical protein
LLWTDSSNFVILTRQARNLHANPPIAKSIDASNAKYHIFCDPPTSQLTAPIIEMGMIHEQINLLAPNRQILKARVSSYFYKQWVTKKLQLSHVPELLMLHCTNAELRVFYVCSTILGTVLIYF